MAFSTVNRFSVALLYGRAGRLTAENCGFWPGQFAEWKMVTKERRAAGLPRHAELEEEALSEYAEVGLASDLGQARPPRRRVPHSAGV